MSEADPNSPYGRPKIEIDWKEFDKLCRFGCTKREIADWYSCSESAIEEAVKREKQMTFTMYHATHLAKTKVSLRRKQLEMALEKENVEMLKLCGKIHLNQTDKIQLDMNVDVRITDQRVVEMSQELLDLINDRPIVVSDKGLLARDSAETPVIGINDQGATIPNEEDSFSKSVQEKPLPHDKIST